MTTPKYTKAPEILWIAVAVMSLGAAVHKTWFFGFRNSLLFYGFVFIASAMWLLRRLVRKNREKQAQENK
jgi:hypothetical protein